MSLAGKNVVIIGGSTGIGFATARLAVQQGAAVTITGRSADKLEVARKELGNVRALTGDATREADVARVFAGLDTVDHVFVSAGSVTLGEVCGTDLAVFRAGIDERIWASLYVIRAARPKMSSGSITLMSGIRADRPVRGTAMTTVGVAAVEALTRALPAELAPVRVNAVSPGWVETPLVRGLLGDNFDPVITKAAAELPVKRIGRPDEIARGVLLLMTNEYINGEVLHLDGGGRSI
jgi:NAD(P)-dependent dehydrogenase (short-subunit alcohol dehydrogenase family)